MIKWFLRILLLLLAGCARLPAFPTPIPTPTPAPIPNPLAGTYWALRTINNQPILSAYPLHLRFFERELKLRGDTGCNFYEARYTIDPAAGQMKLEYFTLTVQLCLDTALMAQEAALAEAWSGDIQQPQPLRFQFKEEGGAAYLEILNPTGETALRFEKAP